MMRQVGRSYKPFPVARPRATIGSFPTLPGETAHLIDARSLLSNPSPSLGWRTARWLLRCLSLPYAIAVRARNAAYDWGWKKAYRAPLPVVSVGNLSVGGTGKSPMVAWLARWMRDRNLRVAILSRGYGQLDSGQNDEALELEGLLPDVPHLQHWDRVASSQLAHEELDMQVLLLDDGFQHRRMARDLDIVLIDASENRTAQWLLPGGLMREPLSSLRRADAVVLTRVDQATAADVQRLTYRVRDCAPSAKLVLASHHPARVLVYPDRQREVASLRGQKVLAFCAIGNPASFFRSLNELQATVLDCKSWPDHHGFDKQDIAELVDWQNKFPEADLLICTVKDWVKIQLAKVGRLELAALGIELRMVSGQTDLEQLLNARLAPVIPAANQHPAS